MLLFWALFTEQQWNTNSILKQLSLKQGFMLGSKMKIQSFEKTSCWSSVKIRLKEDLEAASP